MTAIKLDEAALNAAACANLRDMLPRILDHKGTASPDVTGLGDRAEPIRITEYRVFDNGAWRALSHGASGRDLISLVAFLADVDRPTATAFLARLTERVAA